LQYTLTKYTTVNWPIEIDHAPQVLVG